MNFLLQEALQYTGGTKDEVQNDSQFGTGLVRLLPLTALRLVLSKNSTLMDRIHGYLNKDSRRN